MNGRRDQSNPSGSGKVRRVIRRLRRVGVRGLISALVDRVVPARPALQLDARAAAAGKIGLEIGGPSRVFSRRGILPVYPHAARIDNINFATRTAWEASLEDGGHFVFDSRRAPGTQWLREAVQLSGIVDDTYDLVVSSHCLEHVANPLGALQEWRRVTRPGGHLVLVLPDPKRTFDHRRPVTTIGHLREDRARNTTEDDMTHAAEAMALHDVARDAGVGSAGEFNERVRSNALNRCLHHHVFDLALMDAALADTGWQVLALEKARPLHLLAFARKENG
jgi:SAM-dependent methyltransferase